MDKEIWNILGTTFIKEILTRIDISINSIELDRLRERVIIRRITLIGLVVKMIINS